MTSVPEQTRRDGWAGLDGSERAVAVEVLRFGPLPRAELSRRLGLSPGSLTRLTRPLLERGLLVEEGPELQARTGRPSVPLDVRPTRARFVGITVDNDDNVDDDSEVTAVLTDLRATVVDRTAARLAGRSPDDVVRCVRAVHAAFTAAHGPVAGVGVGVDGLVSAHRDVVVAPPLGWTDPVPLATRLADELGVPVSVDNDVRALAAAEHWFGAARGLHSFALVTVGNVVGAALVVHDEQVCGAHGMGGAIGHLPIAAPVGTPCELGHRGCARAVLGTPGLTAGHPHTVHELLDRARRGDPDARAVTDAAGSALGVLVGGVVALADPEVVLVAGSAAGLVEVARPALDAALAGMPRPGADPVAVRVAPFDVTDRSRGAAVVAVQDHVRGGHPDR